MKTYEAPALIEIEVEIEDVIASSFGVNEPGDVELNWPWKN